MHPAQAFVEDGRPVALLLVSVADSAAAGGAQLHSAICCWPSKAERLLKADAAGVLALLTSDVAEEEQRAERQVH